MSLAQGLKAGADIVKDRELLRQSAAKQNAELRAKGFDESGNAIEGGTYEKQEDVLKKQLDMQAMELKRMKASVYAKDTASALDASISEGNWSYTDNLLKKNEELGKMWQNRGVYGVSNINFDTDQKMLAAEGLKPQDYNTDEKRQAIHKAVFKVADANGNYSLRTATDALVETNARGNLAHDRLKSIQSTLKSSVTALKPSQEDELSKFTTSYTNLYPDATEDEIYEAFGKSPLSGSKGENGLNEFQVNYTQYKAAVEGGYGGTFAQWKEMQKPKTAAAVEDRTKSKEAQQGELEFIDNLKASGEEQLTKEGVFERAKILQGDKKVGEVESKNLKGKLTTLRAFTDLAGKLNKIDVPKDMVEKAQSFMSKLLTTEFTSLSEKEKLQELNKMQFGAQFEAAVAEYVKFMSGAAVTENERTMYNDIVSGGKWGTKEAMISSLSGFMTHLDNTYNSDLTNIADNYPADYIRQKREYLKTKKIIEKSGLREMSDMEGKSVPQSQPVMAPKTDLSQYNFGGK